MGGGEERWVLETLQQNFPSLAIQTVRRLGEGWRNRAYLVNEATLFRFPKDQTGAKDLEKEMRVLPLLRDRLTLQIPVFLYCGIQENGYPFVGYQLVPGEPLEEERFSSFPDDVQGQIAGQLALFLRQLRSFPVLEATPLAVPMCDFFAYYTALSKKVQERLFPRIRPELQAYLSRRFAWYLEEGRHFQFIPVLLHGDLSLDHLLTNSIEGQLTGIIDFGDLLIGDPAFEYRYLLEECGWEFTRRVMERVGEEDIPGMGGRIGFFLTADAAEYALEGLERGDPAMLQEGVALLDEERQGNVLY